MAKLNIKNTEIAELAKIAKLPDLNIKSEGKKLAITAKENINITLSELSVKDTDVKIKNLNILISELKMKDGEVDIELKPTVE